MPTDKRLFVVQVTTEVIVLADDADEASKLANENRRDIIDDGDPDVTAVAMTYYPGHWDEDAIPYGFRDDESPDRTVGEWVEDGAAPELKKRMASLAKAGAGK